MTAWRRAGGDTMWAQATNPAHRVRARVADDAGLFIDLARQVPVGSGLDASRPWGRADPST
jgi:hypothetical protein